MSDRDDGPLTAALPVVARSQAGVRQPAERKLFAGPRLKRMRAQIGLTQTRMAEELGVSVSYLNLIERNQRPVTAQFLLRLADTYTLDVRDLMSEGAEQSLAEVLEVMTDPLFLGLDISRQELDAFVQGEPVMARAMVKLYDAYRRVRLAPSTAESAAGRGIDTPTGPLEEVRDIIERCRNHFTDIDSLAETIAEDIRLSSDDLFAGLKERLRQRHGITVRVLPIETMPDALRRFDFHRQELYLSELLDAAGRNFNCAHHLGLVEAHAEIGATIEGLSVADTATQRLMRINLANYFAAALMMPYGRFYAAAETCGYDMELLAARFGASFEQVAHRLTTLQRPGQRGIPFFMIRVDQAGNVSKRFSATRFHFSKYGGTCPIWCVHTCFRQPGKVITQLAEVPDGTLYFTVARTVRNGWTPWGGIEPSFAIGVGCELRYAKSMVYTRGLDLVSPQATPIGPGCAMCDRAHCRQRSQPPAGQRLLVEEGVRGPAPYSFQP